MHKKIHYFLLTVFAIVLSTIVYAQPVKKTGKFKPKDTNAVRLISCVGFNNPNRTKYIKDGHYLNIFLKTDSAGLHVYSGPAYVGDSSLVVVGASEIYHGYSEADATYVERSTNFRETEFIIIPIKDIDYISYQPGIEPYFSTLFGISLATSLLSVPLAAINYKSGGFNSGQILGISAVTAVVSFTLTKIFRERKFRMKRARN